MDLIYWDGGENPCFALMIGGGGRQQKHILHKILLWWWCLCKGNCIYLVKSNSEDYQRERVCQLTQIVIIVTVSINYIYIYLYIHTHRYTIYIRDTVIIYTSYLTIWIQLIISTYSRRWRDEMLRMAEERLRIRI